MTTFVLVHGAWHGGWCWGRLRPILEARGNHVWAPTLTGLGDRAHLARPDTGVETHVQDILHTIVFEDLTDVVMVAHSYGGIPATVVMHRCPERVSALIYLDSAMPLDGQNAFDAFPGSEAEARAAVALSDISWLVPPLDRSFGITTAADLAWVQARLRPHPWKAFSDRIQLGIADQPVPVVSIMCAEDAAPDAVVARGFAEIPTIWIQAGHDAMITEPEMTADAIAQALDLVLDQRA